LATETRRRLNATVKRHRQRAQHQVCQILSVLKARMTCPDELQENFNLDRSLKIVRELRKL